MVNKVVKFARASASQCIAIWNPGPAGVTFVNASDAGSPGSARRGGAQSELLALASGGAIRRNRRVQVGLPARRSQRRKRVVASGAAAEMLSLSGALAVAQRLQIIRGDVVFG
eukprot:8041468-Pyramimonas_sp.AAC.1